MRAIALAALAACSPPTIDLPGGGKGIGFDDLRYSARLNRVLAPGGRTGNLALVDPLTHEVSVIGGFSTTDAFDESYDFGITSVDDTGTLLAVVDRTTSKLSLVDPDAATVVADATTGPPDYVRWVAATRELWISEPDVERIEIFAVDPMLHRVATVAVPGGPESLVIDQRHGIAYTNLWAGSTIAVDIATRTLGPAWPNRCGRSRGIAVDEELGFVFASCVEGRVVVLDPTDGHVLGEDWSVSGADVIDWSPSRRHLYVPGAISGDLAIIGVSRHGEAALLGLRDGAVYGHCVTTDDAGHTFVCDLRQGRLLADDDPFAAVR
jgi:hypothetical protein